LTSAHFIAKEFPQSKVVVFEAGKDKGGWIKSRRVDVVDAEGKKGNVLFELGPRTLRNATVTAGLVSRTYPHRSGTANGVCVDTRTRSR
jgi:oxygen-dependent protoporphyrinogen oxidase